MHCSVSVGANVQYQFDNSLTKLMVSHGLACSTVINQIAFDQQDSNLIHKFKRAMDRCCQVLVSKFSLTHSQSASSLKVIQKSTFVLSRSAPIRRSERSVWASSLPDSSNNVMAVVKRGISCLNFFRIVTCISLQYDMDH